MKLLKYFALNYLVFTFANAYAASEYSSLTPEIRQKKAAVLAAHGSEDDSLSNKQDSIVRILPQPIEKPSVLEEIVSESLDPPSLEENVDEGVVQKSLLQFGYDIFTSLPSTFAPITNIPVPENYIIGPGDKFTVQIFSATDVQYTLVVTREGRLLIPEIGDLQVSGLTFSEAKTLINESIQTLRIGSKSVVTLSDLRTIQVMLVGEVTQPGSYTVSGLSSLLNVLVNAGGIKRSGSLRNIQLRRSGVTVSDFDLYALLLKGEDKGNVSLRQGDVIFVPPIGTTVGIAGEVQRPAIYEIKSETNVSDVLTLAGGFLPTAAPSRSQVERISGDNGYNILQVDLSLEGNKTTIANGDLIRILPVLEKFNNVVSLEGHVISPRSYQWTDNMRVSDLFGDIDSFRLGTDFSVGILIREDLVTKRSKVIYFDLSKALAGIKEHNIKLSPRDTVRVFDTAANRAKLLESVVKKMRSQRTFTQPEKVITLKGYSRHTGDFPLQEGLRLLDLIDFSDGLGEGLDRISSLLVRTDPITGDIIPIKMSIAQALNNPSGDHNPILKPKDRIYLFGKESNRSAMLKGEIDRLRSQAMLDNSPKIVNVSGQISNPGAYPLTPGMTVEDLIFLAGGLNVNAFSTRAVLSRVNELNNESSKVIQHDISLKKPSTLSPNKNTLLKPYDQLVILEKPEWVSKPVTVKIDGEINFPGVYTLDKRETMCGLVQKAGGFTEQAYIFGTVFMRESVRKREQEALDRLMGELDDLLAEVHLSPGYQKDEKMPVNQGTNDTYRVIKELAPKKALGRMVVDVQSAMDNCGYDGDLLLEDGDSITIPKYQEEVSVLGQVYFPTSHQFKSTHAALDYINLSGGTKELAQREHAYIVQANGEVMSVRSSASSWGWLMSPKNVEVTPGSTIYVPLSVDRINGREFAQSWVDLFYKLTLGMAGVDYLFK